EVVASYHRAAAEAISRYGGHVAQYLGEGVMAYFGWPEAHENDAERATRASLAVRAGLETQPAVYTPHTIPRPVRRPVIRRKRRKEASSCDCVRGSRRLNFLSLSGRLMNAKGPALCSPLNGVGLVTSKPHCAASFGSLNQKPT